MPTGKRKTMPQQRAEARERSFARLAARRQQQVPDGQIIVRRDLPGVPKLSDALTDIAMPWLENVREKRAAEDVFRLACVAWNLANRLDTITRLSVRRALKETPLALAPDVEDTVFAMLKAKHAGYRDDKRHVTDFEITALKDEFRVAVMYTEPPQ